MTSVEVFGDIAESLARMNPSKIISLKAPAAMAERVNELIQRKKEETITLDEATELERLMALDLLINLAKARAKKMLAA